VKLFLTLGLFLASAPWFEYPRKHAVMCDEKLCFLGRTYQNRVSFVLALEEHSIVSTKSLVLLFYLLKLL